MMIERQAFRDRAAKLYRWLDDRLVMAPGGQGKVLPRVDSPRFRELANDLWWTRIQEVEPAFPPDDLDSGFDAFEAALRWQDQSEVISIAAQLGRPVSMPVPIDIEYDAPTCDRVVSALRRMASASTEQGGAPVNHHADLVGAQPPLDIPPVWATLLSWGVPYEKLQDCTKIIDRKDISADNKFEELADIDNCFATKKAPELGDLLGVTGAAIRLGKFWIALQKKKREEGL